ncbi:hypothetical protein VTL71DRAFT_340 [Oculimacula yallundae]|uniref:Protein kinase domain-containing protein n=1 Tax=Oculimacula yallundae TaxID=86028 RepID=A0ABR4CZT6_9HELO
MDQRVMKLATLLSLPNRPAQFRTPFCLGYINDHTNEQSRYGFLYRKPSTTAPDTKPTSLLDLIKKRGSRPSLTKRIALAHAIAQSLMYLHSVNWLHKGICSDKIAFFIQPDEQPSYSEPIICGFDYARLDQPDEMTEPRPRQSSYDVYRHPAILTRANTRSTKSHDIYSLGVVLVEIAMWQRIGDIVGMPQDEKAAIRMLPRVGVMLTKDGYMDAVEGHAGEVYRSATQKCLTGLVDLGIYGDVDDSTPDLAVEMQRVFSEDVVDVLGEIKL